MARASNWYPNEIYRHLFNLGHKNELAYNEVAFMLLREALAPYGFDCPHKRVGYPKNAVGRDNNKPYCKDCYCRLEQFLDKRILRGRIITDAGYRAIETFVDITRKENSKKFEADNEARIKTEVDARLKALVDSTAKTKKDNDNDKGKDLVQ